VILEMAYIYIGNCVQPPFPSVEDLTEVVENAIEIAREEMWKHCIDEIPSRTISDMAFHPDDFRYYKSEYDGKSVMFFTHSCIEYFWREGGI